MTCVYDEPRAGVDDQQPRGEPAGWRGPNGYALLSWEVDFRRGGVSRLRVRSPEGRDHLVDGVQLEIVEPERVVFRGDPGVEGLSEATGTFTFRRAEPNRTRN
jgi:uncharacterized protein YndB with AHSA1/START domain